MTASFSEWQEDTEWYDDPDPSIKGFEYVRSDVAQVTKDVQYDIFESLLNDDNPRGSVFDTVKSYIDDVMEDDIPLQDVGKRFGISKKPTEYGSADRTPMPQYRGSKYANQHLYGTDAIDSGSDAIYYYVDKVRDGPYPKTYRADTAEDGRYVDAIAVLHPDDIPDEIVIDRRKMTEKTILSYVESIITSMGWSYEELENHLDQQTPASYYRDSGQKGLSAENYL